MTVGNPEVRERIGRLLESQWRVPVTVVFLNDVKPAYQVPGRRNDGTVTGQRLVRRFFWNVLRYTIGGLASVILSIASETAGHVFGRDGRVTGPENAQALGLVDAAVKADSAWLVYSQSHVAVVDSGYSFREPADAELTILWHAAGTDAPRIVPIRRCVRWRDGSEFVYDLSYEEARFLRQSPRQ